MQIKVSKSKAIESLSAHRDAVEGLRSANAESPEFLKWRTDLIGLLRYMFGEKSSEYSTLRSISFSPPGVHPRRPKLRKAYQSGLANSEALIESLIGQVEDYWVDDRESTHSGDKDGAVDLNQVFVAHGRDHGALSEVKLVLSQLGLEPVVLQDLPNQGRTIVEKFEDYSRVAFAVVVCTPDDNGGLASADVARKPRVRQNVLLEWGFFLGRLGREKVFALIKDEVEIPSDYDGVLYVEMDDGGAWKMKLVRELKAAQYAVDANKLV